MEFDDDHCREIARTCTEILTAITRLHGLITKTGSGDRTEPQGSTQTDAKSQSVTFIDPNALYEVPDVARYLRISKNQACIWLGRKELIGAKVGRRWLIKGKDILAFVDARIEGKRK